MCFDNYRKVLGIAMYKERVEAKLEENKAVKMDVKGPREIARKANCKSSETMLLASNRPLRSKGHVISRERVK